MLTLLVAVLLAPPDATTSWARFRGPNGSGQATGFHWPTQWNENAILWKTAVPGVGHASPIIHDGAIYLQSSEKELHRSPVAQRHGRRYSTAGLAFGFAFAR